VAVKRLARQIRDRECSSVPLPKAGDLSASESLRGFLESVGAVAVVEAVDPAGAPNDGRDTV